MGIIGQQAMAAAGKAKRQADLQEQLAAALRERDRLKFVLANLLAHAQYTCDEGESGTGWKSDGFKRAIAEAESLVGEQPMP